MAATQNLAILPLKKGFKTRLLEILPGFTAWAFLLSPIYLGLLAPVWLAYLIIAFDLWWLAKALGLAYRLVRGYNRLNVATKIKWEKRLEDLKDVSAGLTRVKGRLKSDRIPWRFRRELKRYRRRLQQLANQPETVLNPDEVIHAAVVAVYNESLEILEPTIKALTNVTYDTKKLWLFIAYEERGGEQTETNAKDLVERYAKHFGHAEAVKHPNGVAGEAKVKGANITHTGRRLLRYAKQQQIEPERVLVTTLDSDNRPHPSYFAYLTFMYCSLPERIHCSYQPIPMFYNNIWDAPAPMRVIATGNTFWQLMEAMRPHRLRNFSSHAQSLRTLIDTDFWSVQSFVEDGHQYWRTFYTYNGNHRVVPLYMPVYQDAVLAVGYWRTFRAQFKQLRRWAWGVTDIPYVIVNNWRYRKKIPLGERLVQFFRLYEGHLMWATAPLVLALAAWFPLLLNQSFNDQALAHQLPVIASRIQTLTSAGVIITIIISLISLPPRPAHYKTRRSIMMILQWVLLPVTTVVFGSFAAINAQTRLMLGRYLETFDVTEKATRAQQTSASRRRGWRFWRTKRSSA